MKRALIVGGANGIGLSIATELAKIDECEKIYIVDKVEPAKEYTCNKFEYYQFDLMSSDYSLFDNFVDIDTLMITAGFGHLALFKDLKEQYIVNSMTVNSIAVMRIIYHFYDKIQSSKDFYCGIMVSIAGFMSSPFFSVYGASKAALKIFIESVNVELEKAGTTNRILNVSPGAISGTSFYNATTNLNTLQPLTSEIIKKLYSKDDLFIPLYDEIYKEVLHRYHNDFRAEGIHSYEYKLKKMDK